MHCLVLLVLSVHSVLGYFTLHGKCPENVKLQDNFKLADFFEKWYQVGSYSSDGQLKNNCSVLELSTASTGIYLNQSRIDRGLFARYSMARVEIPADVEKGSHMDLTFTFKDAPRRLMIRTYPFHVLATNYNYYAAIYTCQYSQLIDKHYIYVWLLSRTKSLNVVSKELAKKAIKESLGIDSDVTKFHEEDWDKCQAKYYEDKALEPVTFRYPVLVQ